MGENRAAYLHFTDENALPLDAQKDYLNIILREQRVRRGIGDYGFKEAYEGTCSICRKLRSVALRLSLGSVSGAQKPTGADT